MFIQQAHSELVLSLVQPPEFHFQLYQSKSNTMYMYIALTMVFAVLVLQRQWAVIISTQIQKLHYNWLYRERVGKRPEQFTGRVCHMVKVFLKATVVDTCR